MWRNFILMNILSNFIYFGYRLARICSEIFEKKNNTQAVKI